MSATRAQPTRAVWEKQCLAVFLAGQRYSGHQEIAELLTRPRGAPEGCVGDAEVAARRALELALVAALGPLVAQGPVCVMTALARTTAARATSRWLRSAHATTGTEVDGAAGRAGGH